MKLKNKSALALIAIVGSYSFKTVAQNVPSKEQPAKMSEVDIKILNAILSAKKITVEKKSETVTIKDIQLLQELKNEIRKFDNRDEIIDDEQLMKRIMKQLEVGKYNSLHEKASKKQDMSFTGN